MCYHSNEVKYFAGILSWLSSVLCTLPVKLKSFIIACSVNAYNMEVTTISLLALFAFLCFAFRRMRIRRNELNRRRRKYRETAVKQQLLLRKNFSRQVNMNGQVRHIVMLMLTSKRNARAGSVRMRPRSSAVFETMWANFND